MSFIKYILLILYVSNVKGSLIDCCSHNWNAVCNIYSFKIIEKVVIPDCTRYQEKIKFYHSELPHIPIDLFEEINFKYVDASGTLMKNILPETFKYAYELEELILNHNNIENISGPVFLGANKLQTLDLSYNKLHTLDSKAFNGLPELKTLNLTNNHLLVLPEDLFYENRLIGNLDLGYNKLHTLDSKTFHGLTKLYNLNLANNHLLALPEDLFYENMDLQSIHLNNNQLNIFQSELLKRLKHINLLNLANNQLKIFNFSRNLIFIEELNLDSNKLTSILLYGAKIITAVNNSITQLGIVYKKEFTKLILRNNSLSDIMNITLTPNLEELDLSFNPIGTPNISNFKNLQNLRKLNLKACNITKLYFGMFGKQDKLNLLDLSYNSITELNLDFFMVFNSQMQNFYIDANNLSEIKGSYSFHETFPNLKELGISRNHFNCTYLQRLLYSNQLSSIKLHIEEEEGEKDMPFIRNIPCISHDPKITQEHEHKEMSENNEKLHQPMDFVQKLRNENVNTNLSKDFQKESLEKMQNYLLIIIIIMLVFIIILCSICLILTIKYWRPKKSKFHQNYGDKNVIYTHEEKLML